MSKIAYMIPVSVELLEDWTIPLHAHLLALLVGALVMECFGESWGCELERLELGFVPAWDRFEDLEEDEWC